MVLVFWFWGGYCRFCAWVCGRISAFWLIGWPGLGGVVVVRELVRWGGVSVYGRSGTGWPLRCLRWCWFCLGSCGFKIGCGISRLVCGLWEGFLFSLGQVCFVSCFGANGEKHARIGNFKFPLAKRAPFWAWDQVLHYCVVGDHDDVSTTVLRFKWNLTGHWAYESWSRSEVVSPPQLEPSWMEGSVLFLCILPQCPWDTLRCICSS